jgi:hypothetical protein
MVRSKVSHAGRFNGTQNMLVGAYQRTFARKWDAEELHYLPP